MTSIRTCSKCGGTTEYDVAIYPDGRVIRRCPGHVPEGLTPNRALLEAPASSPSWARSPAVRAMRQALEDAGEYGTGWVRFDRDDATGVVTVRTVNPLLIRYETDDPEQGR